jgi:hypothetical protein
VRSEKERGLDVGHTPSGTSLVQSWAAGTQERLSRCRTFAEAAGVSGADLELRAPYRTASLADRDCTKYQLRRNKVRLHNQHNQLEALLEEAHIKLSSLVSDLLGASERRMLQALAEGETDPAALAVLADQRLRVTSTQLRDALVRARSSIRCTAGW